MNVELLKNSWAKKCRKVAGVRWSWWWWGGGGGVILEAGEAKIWERDGKKGGKGREVERGK